MFWRIVNDGGSSHDGAREPKTADVMALWPDGTGQISVRDNLGLKPAELKSQNKTCFTETFNVNTMNIYFQR